MPEYDKTNLPPKNIKVPDRNAPEYVPPASGPYMAAVIQKANISPQSLTPADMMLVQRFMGNRVASALFKQAGIAGNTSHEHGTGIIQGIFAGQIKDLDNAKIILLLAELYDGTPPTEEQINILRSAPLIYDDLQSIGLKLHLKKKHADLTAHIKSSLIDASSSLASGGGSVVYRADSRKPEEITSSKGFFSFHPMTPSHSKVLMQNWFRKGANYAMSYMQEWISNPGTAGHHLLSTDFNEDCGGQGSGYYKYKISLPSSFVEREISSKTLGIEPQKITGLTPKLYMDSGTLDAATMIAVKPAKGNELTFVTGVPLRFITEYRQPKDTSWQKMQ